MLAFFIFFHKIVTKWSYMHMKMIQWYLPAIIIFEMVKMNNNKIGRLNMRYFGILLACLQRKHFEITEISRTGDIKWIRNVWFFYQCIKLAKELEKNEDLFENRSKSSFVHQAIATKETKLCISDASIIRLIIFALS